MIPTLSAPNIQVAPPVEASVFTGQNADAALGRLPVVTVPPTVTNAKVADDNRSAQQPQRNSSNTQTPAPNGKALPFSLGGTGELAFESPYSTTFVAQLFGQFQTSDSSLGALSGESTDAPLGFVDFDRLSQVDITKYMPSFAFRPRAETPNAETTDFNTQAVAQVTAPQPQPQTQTPIALPVAAQIDTSLQAEPAQTAAASSEQRSLDLSRVDLQNIAPVSTDDAPAIPQQVTPELPKFENTASPSLFATSGVDAYSSTQSRNLANLVGDSRGGAADQVSLVL